MNMPILTYIKEISPRPILFVHGEKVRSRYFSETAYAAAVESKEPMIIPGAVHTDLYDWIDIIPFDNSTSLRLKSSKHDQPANSPLFFVLACFDIIAVGCVWFILQDPDAKAKKAAAKAATKPPKQALPCGPSRARLEKQNPRVFGWRGFLFGWHQRLFVTVLWASPGIFQRFSTGGNAS